jgi:hypothetical protein
MAIQWKEMTKEERRDQLFQQWLAPEGVKFTSSETEKAYKERVTRLKDAIELKKLPDRVPVFPMTGFFPAYYSGFTPRDVMYDGEKRNASFKKYILDFAPDGHPTTLIAPPGRLFEILDYKLYAWPGHGVPAEVSYQCIEGEYMTADEYDNLIQDPSYFFNNTYLPRVYGAMKPLTAFAPSTWNLEIYGSFSAVGFIPYGIPEVQNAYKSLIEAGVEALKWIGTVAAYDMEMKAAGFPSFFGGGTKAPFDVLGDTLRGTKGIMMDLYRQPDKLLQAMEVMTPIMIKMGASAAKANGSPIVFIPLHKGADGFLSDKQFKTFYWPTLKKLMLGLIEEGCVPFPWAEGGYNSRLEAVKDMPKGTVLWGFDTTDMAKVKEVLGGTQCIAGNMPIDLLNLGTVQQIRETAKNLIDVCGKGGGYIMMSGAVIEDAKPENVKAMIDSTKEFGVYKY